MEHGLGMVLMSGDLDKAIMAHGLVKVHKDLNCALDKKREGSEQHGMGAWPGLDEGAWPGRPGPGIVTRFEDARQGSRSVAS